MQEKKKKEVISKGLTFFWNKNRNKTNTTKDELSMMILDPSTLKEAAGGSEVHLFLAI